MSTSTILFGLAGLFCIVGAAMDWDWFLYNRRARLLVSLFGRTGARICYVVIGIGLIAFGLYYPSLR